MKRRLLFRGWPLALVLLGACSLNAGNTPAAAPACDGPCQDSIALRAVREAMKTAYNRMLTGNDAGPQDETSPCPLGGQIHVFGSASSNAAQGATRVSLSYVFDRCKFASVDTEPTRNYSVTLTGTVAEDGTLAVQPTATTSLILKSDALDVAGSVGVPTVDYSAAACALAIGQNGNQLSGTLCGRVAGVTL
jgi:hypothetical protein